MLTVPPRDLAAWLRSHAAGRPHITAAVELLIHHGVWLDRQDFIAECIDYRSPRVLSDVAVWVDWELIPGFLDDVACSSSEARMLSIAAELAGITTGRSLSDLLTNLDQRNTALVLAAIATHNHFTLPVELIGEHR